jgi:hypothetical protein
VDPSGIDAKALVGGEGFAGEFEQDALEDSGVHECSQFPVLSSQ